MRLCGALCAVLLAACAVESQPAAAVCRPASVTPGIGEVAGEAGWLDHTGAPMSLRQQCGASAVVVVETAVWSTTDAAAAPTFKSWAAAWADAGMRLILAVGEDEFYNASEPHDAKRHKEDHVYPGSVSVVADPLWAGIRAAAGYEGFVGKQAVVPWFVVLDGDLRIRYVGDGGEAPSFPEVRQEIEQLTGVAYEQPSGCSGFCGGQSVNGCFCTAECRAFGDCCGDACSVCGFCE